MANPFERCPSVWKVPDVLRTVVRCERWGGHAGRHRGFNERDMVCTWGDEHVPWNQPVPNNLEVDETVTAEDHRADDEHVLRIELQQWKDRCLEAERVRDNAIHDRDVEVRNAMTAVRQLHDAMEQLQTIRRLTNSVPTRADA